MSPAEGAVRHDCRLEILDRLDNGEPMTLAQLGRELDLSQASLRYHIGRLEVHGLVEQSGTENGSGGSECPYVATLGQQPEWVHQALEDYRHGIRSW